MLALVVVLCVDLVKRSRPGVGPSSHRIYL